ncbi:Prephenate dehydratase-domain-containing protein [Biscogniauxia mediterranea]|nr:Prephenate dehydratase-domain-containing protein [Biscogniauxia mediterranea]
MESSEQDGADAGPVETIRKPIVCFLGPISSYTHQATMQAFSADEYELMPVATIKDIFDTTQSGRATYGVVPFENSTNGSVVFTLDHFADRSGLYPDLNVCREIYLDVHHCIVGYIAPSSPPSSLTTATATAPSHSQFPQDNPSPSSPSQSGQCTPTARDPHPSLPRARPLHSLRHIQRLYSHPQAFGQCTRFLATYLRGVETIDASSTSRAAELVKAEAEAEAARNSAAAAADGGGDDDGGNAPAYVGGAAAAISSSVAAELLGLDILARDVEDRPDNTTRFFVLRKGTSTSTPKEEEDDDDDDDDDEAILARTKTLVSFTVPHRSPGALADVLGCFRAAGLNLTSIASRPSLAPGDEPFQYVFFAECEGHRLRDPAGRVAAALDRVAGRARKWRWLGSWINERPRPRPGTRRQRDGDGDGEGEGEGEGRRVG